MIIDLSNYRLKEDICAATDETIPVIKPSDLLIGGKSIGEFMVITTNREPKYNEDPVPGVQHCRYELLPEEIGLTSYYEICQALLAAFGTTEEELLANDGEMEFPISSVKLGDTIFNATSAWAELSAKSLNVGITGQTFYIDLDVYFENPNIVSLSGGGNFKGPFAVESFAVDIIR